MLTFATLVVYERHGYPSIGYRAETIDQIASGDVAEGSHGAWELRCWTSTGGTLRYGVSADELVALIGATFRAIDRCLGEGGLPEAIRRFHCASDGSVINLPSSQPLDEHLLDWSDQKEINDVFLQIRHVDTAQFQAIRQQLQREIEAMAKVKDELFGQSVPAPTRS